MRVVQCLIKLCKVDINLTQKQLFVKYAQNLPPCTCSIKSIKTTDAAYIDCKRLVNNFFSIEIYMSIQVHKNYTFQVVSFTLNNKRQELLSRSKKYIQEFVIPVSIKKNAKK